MGKMIFEERLKHWTEFHQVVPFDPLNDGLLLMDFTASNPELSKELLEDTNQFTRYINKKLADSGCKYGIGGYDENRTVYSRSTLFEGRSAAAPGSTPIANSGNQPRSVHLGIDIWGRPYTKIMAPLDGIVHSFAFNNAFGDYGATIILTHQLEGMIFHTLYGHLSLNSLKNLQEGERIAAGDVFTEFGIPFENGQWPPHLHFQLILDMEGMKGDYPGVCSIPEREKYLSNCPDPDLILRMMGYARS